MVKDMNVKYAYLIQEAVYRHEANTEPTDIEAIKSLIPEQLKIFECLSNNDYKKAVQLIWYHNYSHLTGTCERFLNDVDSVFEEYLGSDVMKPKLAEIFKKFVKDPNNGCQEDQLEQGIALYPDILTCGHLDLHLRAPKGKVYQILI